MMNAEQISDLNYHTQLSKAARCLRGLSFRGGKHGSRGRGVTVVQDDCDIDEVTCNRGRGVTLVQDDCDIDEVTCKRGRGVTLVQDDSYPKEPMCNRGRGVTLVQDDCHTNHARCGSHRSELACSRESNEICLDDNMEVTAFDTDCCEMKMLGHPDCRARKVACGGQDRQVGSPEGEQMRAASLSTSPPSSPTGQHRQPGRLVQMNVHSLSLKKCHKTPKIKTKTTTRTQTSSKSVKQSKKIVKTMKMRYISAADPTGKPMNIPDRQVTLKNVHEVSSEGGRGRSGQVEIPELPSCGTSEDQTGEKPSKQYERIVEVRKTQKASGIPIKGSDGTVQERSPSPFSIESETTWKTEKSQREQKARLEAKSRKHDRKTEGKNSKSLERSLVKCRSERTKSTKPRLESTDKQATKDSKKKTSSCSERALQIYDPSIRLSKSLAWLLRHSAESCGLQVLPGGFVHVEDVLKVPCFRPYSIYDIKNVVVKDEKKRFRLVLEYGVWKIRANSGHSMTVSGLSAPSGQQRRSGRKRGRSRMDSLEYLSRSMARILRHSAETNGLTLMTGGYLFVDDLLRLRHLSYFTFEDVKKVVDRNEKNRFTLTPCEDTLMWKIKANRGHTLKFTQESPSLVYQTEIPKVTDKQTAESDWHYTKMETETQVVSVESEQTTGMDVDDQNDSKTKQTTESKWTYTKVETKTQMLSETSGRKNESVSLMDVDAPPENNDSVRPAEDLLSLEANIREDNTPKQETPLIDLDTDKISICDKKSVGKPTEQESKSEQRKEDVLTVVDSWKAEDCKEIEELLFMEYPWTTKDRCKPEEREEKGEGITDDWDLDLMSPETCSSGEVAVKKEIPKTEEKVKPEKMEKEGNSAQKQKTTRESVTSKVVKKTVYTSFRCHQEAGERVETTVIQVDKKEQS